MTNLILTQNQTQGYCPELPENSVCSEKQPCTPGYVGKQSNGVQTGKCVPYNSTVNTCEIFAWCPVENDTHVPDPAFLNGAENFTVLIKNNIWYPKFQAFKRNILSNISSSYLKSCQYDKVNHPFCPIFRLGSIVKEAGETFSDMAVQGGVMGIQINWDCDLDWKLTYCVPKYSFRRLDNREIDHNVSPGYNFRLEMVKKKLKKQCWLFHQQYAGMCTLMFSNGGYSTTGHVSLTLFCASMLLNQHGWEGLQLLVGHHNQINKMADCT
ncbi:hypothetical protein XENTR_v10002544 [Xenopus tropicalis]|nr:hypothetical protein XENTR_v10002544 [Xenopus tropicalis]